MGKSRHKKKCLKLLRFKASYRSEHFKIYSHITSLKSKGFLPFASLGMFFTFAKVEKIVQNHFLSEKAYMRDSFHQVIHDVACDGLVLPKICCDEHRMEMVPF